ncbi:Rv3235 family protein [Mycobacterium haemophilum]
MTIGPLASPPRRDSFAVLPVVEYEPPTRNVPQCRQSLHATYHTSRSPHRAGSRLGGRQPEATTAVVLSASMRQAAIFADAALRRVLEVIDRRRPAAQLRPLLAPSLVDSVLSVRPPATGHPPERQGAAVLRRMRLQPVGRHDPDTAAEVSGTYSRGDRIHAIACRVEQVPATDGTRWLVVALHIG